MGAVKVARLQDDEIQKIGKLGREELVRSLEYSSQDALHYAFAYKHGADDLAARLATRSDSTKPVSVYFDQRGMMRVFELFIARADVAAHILGAGQLMLDPAKVFSCAGRIRSAWQEELRNGHLALELFCLAQRVAVELRVWRGRFENGDLDGFLDDGCFQALFDINRLSITAADRLRALSER